MSAAARIKSKNSQIRSPQKSNAIKATNRPHRRLRSVTTNSLLNISGLDNPTDSINSLADDVLQQLHAVANTPTAPNSPSQSTAAWQRFEGLCSTLEFIQQCHPDSKWQAAAQAGLLQLASTALYMQAAAAAAADAATPTAASVDAASTTAGVQRLVGLVSEGDVWLQELSSLQTATAAAAAAIVLDPQCAPVLLVDAASAQAHPILAKDYAAWAAAAGAGGEVGGDGDGAPAAAGGSGVWPINMPAQPELNVGAGAVLDIGSHYAAAAAAAAGGAGQHTSSTSRSSSSGASGQELLMPWPLTAAATQMLLSSPLGLLSDSQLHQVYCLGLLGRCRALCGAVDLARLVGAELQAAQGEQQQLGRQLVSQLESLHRAVQAGSAVDPVVTAAAASAAATAATAAPGPLLRFSSGATAGDSDGVAGAGGGTDGSVACRSAVGHPAVAVSFLQDLAAFGKSAAAGELQSWLELCGADPTLRSYLQASGGLQQLPADITQLQPHQVDSIREAVALAQSCKGGPAAGPAAGAAVLTSGAGTGAGGVGWLQDYTAMPTLLPGVCSVLGDCLQLHIQCSAAAQPGTTWCKEAYVLTVWDTHAAGRNSATSSSSSSSKQRHLRGRIWLLFDEHFQGMPATHMVTPTGLAAQHSADTTAQPHAVGGMEQQQQQQQPGDADQQAATTVAVVFPSSFCSVNRSGGSSGISAAEGSSAFSVLQSLLHELGHSVHFLLSASAAAGGNGSGGGHLASLEVMETASHLVERMARNATCLQAMLRHRDTQQPPHPALIQQLLAYNSISTRGVYQWQQHVLAALTDATLAAQSHAAAAAQDEADASDASPPDGGCREVLQSLMLQYDPLTATASNPVVGQQARGSGTHQQLEHQTQESSVVSCAMLEHLSALVMLQPGDMYCYVFADLVAAALWRRYLAADPLDPVAWQALRTGLFEGQVATSAGDGGGSDTVQVVEGLLGAGSMRHVRVDSLSATAKQQVVDKQLAGGGGVEGVALVSGGVPNLEHACFQDIDLWG